MRHWESTCIHLVAELHASAIGSVFTGAGPPGCGQLRPRCVRVPRHHPCGFSFSVPYLSPPLPLCHAGMHAPLPPCSISPMLVFTYTVVHVPMQWKQCLSNCSSCGLKTPRFGTGRSRTAKASAMSSLAGGRQNSKRCVRAAAGMRVACQCGHDAKRMDAAWCESPTPTPLSRKVTQFNSPLNSLHTFLLPRIVDAAPRLVCLS